MLKMCLRIQLIPLFSIRSERFVLWKWPKLSNCELWEGASYEFKSKRSWVLVEKKKKNLVSKNRKTTVTIVDLYSCQGRFTVRMNDLKPTISGIIGLLQMSWKWYWSLNSSLILINPSNHSAGLSGTSHQRRPPVRLEKKMFLKKEWLWVKSLKYWFQVLEDILIDNARPFWSSESIPTPRDFLENGSK